MIFDHLLNSTIEHHQLSNQNFIVKPSLPILYFGDLNEYFNSEIKIVTVALNPSDMEFKRYKSDKNYSFYRFPLWDPKKNNLIEALNIYYHKDKNTSAWGIKWAQATASLIVLSRKEKDKEKLRQYIEKEFGYDLSRSVDELREVYEYNESCQETVPEAIICFLESTDFEDAIRNAISIGGDSDTLACITGSIAEAYYQEIPEWIIKETMKRLPDDIKIIIKDFVSEYLYKSKTTKFILENVVYDF